MSSDVSSGGTHGVCCGFFMNKGHVVQNMYVSQRVVDFEGTETLGSCLLNLQ